ncbi:MAG: hypothetical protein DMF68_13855 [Acidobacteria bacterium]|nr:MAG: hypothetical protein DMF68_13855 [Acidobacteriota bacterium]
MSRDQSSINCCGSFEKIFADSRDSARCLGSLSKLARHLKEPLIVTGSIATALHLMKNGMGRQMARLNDIDAVAEGLHCVRSSLSQDFLINHFHPLRGGGGVLLQLVDEEYSTRIEVFTPNSKTLNERLTDFAIGNLRCRTVSAEDVLAKLLSIIYPATKGCTVDPKYVEHFEALYATVDLKVAVEIWPDYRKENHPLSFYEAAEAVQRSIRDNPALLQREEYCQDINFVCRWCCASDEFPLAVRSKVYEILGYV